MKFWHKKAEADASADWTDRLPPGFLEEGDRLAANAWAALGIGAASDEEAHAVTERPRTWTAPVSGRYHVVSGREPHLVENCTEECAE